MSDTALKPATPTASSTIRWTLLFAFALSGFSGLVYESVWASYLKLLLGHAAHAQTLVLIIFMGGMALGSWYAATRSVGWRNLLLGYAIVEGAIGLAGIFFHGVFDASINWAHNSVMPTLESPGLITAFKWLLATVLVLPQSIALGMSFPLMSGALVRRFPGTSGATLAGLYFSNSLGAAIGILVGGFALVPVVGLPGTVMAAGLINILLAGVIWLMCKRGHWVSAPIDSQPSSDATQDGRPWLLLSVAAATGAASFVYEIGWIRMLSLVLGASTHAFELMLSAFILGLALGSWWIRNRIETITHPLRFLGAVQISMGLLALGTIVGYNGTFDLMGALMQGLARNESGYWLFNLSSHAIAMAVMLPVTFCAGMTLPLITAMLVRTGFGERSIGHVYAANTIGAIIGVVAAVHFLLPLVGLKFTIGAGAALDLLLGIVLLQRSGLGAARHVWSAVCVGALVLAMVIVEFNLQKMVSGVFRYCRTDLTENTKVLSHTDGKTASVSLLEFDNGIVAILTNGKTDAAIQLRTDSELSTDELTMTLIGALALGAKPDAQSAAVVGFGAGMSTHVALASANLKRLDTIEIEPAMYEAARVYHPIVSRAYDDPRSNIHFDDARSFFSSQKAGYDIIMSEPSNPWVSGIATLFTSEFYQRAQRSLAKDGIFVQWIHGFEISMPLLASTVKALDSAFGNYKLYNLNDRDLLFVAGANGPITLNPGALFDMDVVEADLARIGVTNANDLNVRYLGSQTTLGPLFASYSIPANSDYFPVLDNGAVKARFLQKNAKALLQLRSDPVPLVELLEPMPSKVDRESLTSAPWTHIARRKTSAIEFLESLDAGNPNWTRLPAPLARLRVDGELLWSTCGQAPFAQRWHQHVFDLTTSLAPDLPESAREVVRANLSPASCAGKFTPAQQAQLDLFDGLLAKDANKIAAAAQQLLREPAVADETMRRLHVKAGLAANLARRDRGDVQRIIAQWLPQPVPEGSDLALRLLRSLALTQLSGQQ